MGSGIRATVEFGAGTCPVADLSATADATIDAVDASVCPDEGTGSVTEFTLEGEADPPERFTEVFAHGQRRRYRFLHEGGVDCPCECLGAHGCPVTRYVAREGRLTVVFHAADYDELQTLVSDLRDRFPSVDIKRFVRSPDEETTADAVFVDRRKLTDRQREVLATAYQMGYFERPRRANATEVARELGIDPSTFSEHLAAAESKILDDFL